MKGRLFRLKKLPEVERTFEERETLMERWIAIANLEQMVNTLLDEY